MSFCRILLYAVRSFFTMSRISLADGKRAGQKVQRKIAVAVQKVFHSFAGFWYPANKICISLVYINGTNIETKEKKCRTRIHRTESRHIHRRACSSVI
jgi:hypothetical protein